MTLRIATLLTMIAGGVWTGLAVSVAHERLHTWSRMTLEEYAVDNRRHLKRFDPLQPILGLVTIVGAVLLAVDRDGTARALAIAAAVLMALIIVASIFLGEPINNRFRRVPEGVVPEGAAELRVRWARFHRVRTLAGVTMFVLLVLAVSYA